MGSNHRLLRIVASFLDLISEGYIYGQKDSGSAYKLWTKLTHSVPNAESHKIWLIKGVAKFHFP